MNDKPFGHDRLVAVQARHLAMLAPFVSSETTRYYLQGVYIEPVDGGVIMVATDGHCMGIIHDKDASANAPWICEIDHDLLDFAEEPIEHIVFAGQHMHAVDPDSLSSSLTERDIWSTSHASRLLPPINGIYPNWRKVVPDKFAGEAISPMLINTRKMQQVDAAAKAGGSEFDAIRFHVSGQFAPLVARVTGVPEFVGLIMPMKAETRDADPIPDWLHAALGHGPQEQEVAQ